MNLYIQFELFDDQSNLLDPKSDNEIETDAFMLDINATERCQN